MDEQIQRLSELNRVTSRSGRSATSARTGFSRYARRPDYTSPSVKGTRPASGRGVTFHFKHTYVSKRNSVASGYQNETSASAHQDYIERRGACETLEEPDGTRRDISFGTIGENKAERAEFWRKVERSEGRKARVQCRMIVELPHELDARGRESLARDFCRTLDDNGLPYHCAVHAPDRKNDPRNHHMHIAYFDRPARRMEDGQWDFEVTERVRGTNRVERTRRPYKQNKDRTAQGAEWVTHLRRQYADVANAYLAVYGADKRYDPRSYKDSGVTKEPTLHLGTRRAHAESQGLDTKAGRINASREISFQLSSAEAHFHQRRARMKLHADGLRRSRHGAPSEADEIDAIAGLCEDHADLSKEGLEVAKKRAVHRIAGEAVTGRLDKRMAFLKKEADRLVVAPPRAREGDALDVSKTLHEEYDAASEAKNDLSPFERECARIATTQTQRLAGISREQAELEKEIHKREKALVRKLGGVLDASDAEHLVTTSEMVRDIRMTGHAKTESGAQNPDDGKRAAGMESLDDLSPETGLTQAQRTSRDDKRSGVPDRRETSSDTAETASAPDPLIGLFQRLKNSKEDAKERDRRTGSGPSVFDTAGDTSSDLPDAIPVDPRASTEEVLALQKRLAKVTNGDLRRHAFATRDRADLSDADTDRQRYLTGLNVIEQHAKNRGLDLDSGVHRPEKAADPTMARMHTDSVNPMSRARWWDPNVRVRS